MVSVASGLGEPEEWPPDRCSYCGKQLYPGVFQCANCGNYTDGKGPLAKKAAQRTKFWTWVPILVVGLILPTGLIGIIVSLFNN